MNSINIDITQAVSLTQMQAAAADKDAAVKTLDSASGAGNDFLGWTALPSRTTQALLDEINDVARSLRESCDIVVCIGIGGSYLGAKFVIDSLSDCFAAYRPAQPGAPRLLFAGQNISEDYLFELQSLLTGKRFGIIVISKSGTTTEPAIAFRILKEQLEAAEGREIAAQRIVAVTDAKRGALRTLATREGYRTFVIDDNVGGRYSVLTPVGLLPIAVAGYDINALVEGARKMETRCKTDDIAATYAEARNILYRDGKKIEILVNYTPRLHYLGEWWKQLYGESEGKDHKGIFPASVDFSTDLHSMGQMIQDGERTVFETVVSVTNTAHSLTIPTDADNLDGLNYIAGKHIDQVNKMAETGTRLAHLDGGVPNITITIDTINEDCLGQLIYFFERACGISGYMLGINPFNQPGVENYKRNMFALLEKPGYEAETEAIKKRLGK
ncbi:MAG: glucose-6-phosphate isomerase [Bacteroidales bacterium]|nr:glucose-6-phosphate isomerase [Bacteroidales bacterium]